VTSLVALEGLHRFAALEIVAGLARLAVRRTSPTDPESQADDKGEDAQRDDEQDRHLRARVRAITTAASRATPTADQMTMRVMTLP
jgi:hypothetical protein